MCENNLNYIVNIGPLILWALAIMLTAFNIWLLYKSRRSGFQNVVYQQQIIAYSKLLGLIYKYALEFSMVKITSTITEKNKATPNEEQRLEVIENIQKYGNKLQNCYSESIIILPNNISKLIQQFLILKHSLELKLLIQLDPRVDFEIENEKFEELKKSYQELVNILRNKLGIDTLDKDMLRILGDDNLDNS